MALVVAAAAASALHGLANIWLWGHDGYNGSAFSQAARNSLRFGIIEQAQYYTGLAPPDLSEIYTNHPLLLHFHLMGMFQLFGVHEWASRLVPALYSLGIVLLVFISTRHYFGRGPALLAITLWVLTPLHLIFANMVDHEQGSIFWCLMFVYMYLRWLDDGRRRHLVATLAAVTMAVQFDWPGYYLAFLVALHALFHGIYRGRRDSGRRGLRWPREFRFVGWFSATVLLNFALFIGWIWALRGGLDKMFGAFSMRSSEASNYLDVLARRSVDLYGVPLLALLAAWLLWASARLARGTARRAELIPWLFFFGQLIHSAVFQTAGIIHAYWTYHVGPALAIGGALTLWSAGGALWRFAQRRGPSLRAALIGAGVVAGLALFGGQLVYAVTQLRWGYDTGRAAYAWRYQDEYCDTEWAKDLSRHFARDEVSYIIHESAIRRIHFLYYLDAPRTERHHRLGFTPAEERGADGKRYVLLADLERLGEVEREQVAVLASRYHTLVWDRRFVAFDASRPIAGRSPRQAHEAWIAESGEATWWWRWLHDYRRPPVRWVPDPCPEAVEALLAPPRPRGPGELAGGDGGHLRAYECPDGLVASRLRVRSQPRGARLVEAIEVDCELARPVGLPTTQPERSYARPTGPWLGGDWLHQPPRTLSCRAGQLPVGIHGRGAKFVDAIGLLCAHASALSSGSGGPWRLALAEPKRTRAVGGHGGKDFERRCPPGQALTGIITRAGALVDAVGITCAPYDQPFVERLLGPR